MLGIKKPTPNVRSVIGAGMRVTGHCTFAEGLQVDGVVLGDVARAEWALHRAASAADAEPDLPSFARLASEDPHGLTLSLSPGATVIGSRFQFGQADSVAVHGAVIPARQCSG